MIRFVPVLAIGGMLFFGLYTVFREKIPHLQPATEALSVTVILPQYGSILQTVSATGITIPREEIQVMSELENVRVSDVLVDVGDSITKGQPLVILDGQSQANQVSQLKSDYERTRDAFSRIDAIKDSGAVSKQIVTEKSTAMQAAKALLDDAELNLARSTINSPEDGVIFERKALIGGLVNNNEPLFRIARHNEIELEAQVPESTVYGLKIGQAVVVTLTGQSAAIEGKIRLVTPRINDSTRMAAIRIQLSSTEPIPVGLFATAQITQSKSEGFLLPKTALQQDSTGDFLWALTTENIAERMPVVITLYSEEQVMVETIAPDVRVVARAGAFIKDGDRVNVVEEK